MTGLQSLIDVVSFTGSLRQCHHLLSNILSQFKELQTEDTDKLEDILKQVLNVTFVQGVETVK